MEQDDPRTSGMITYSIAAGISHYGADSEHLAQYRQSLDAHGGTGSMPPTSTPAWMYPVSFLPPVTAPWWRSGNCWHCQAACGLAIRVRSLARISISERDTCI